MLVAAAAVRDANRASELARRLGAMLCVAQN